MKRFLILSALGLLPAAACDDQATTTNLKPNGTNEEGGTVTTKPGVCRPSDCPKPATGTACCTPNADCGMDPTGTGITCLPSPDSASSRECKRDGDTITSDGKECPVPPIGTACCTALGGCGWDPFASGLVCFANPPPIKPTCDITKCTKADAGPNPCCLPNGTCGVDSLGLGICFPPPLPPPPPSCDIKKCPPGDGGLAPCCLGSGCGVDSLGIGICFPPPPPAGPACVLSKCPRVNDINPCCLPNGQCGTDTLGIGVCFLPPLPPVSTTPPDDPSINDQCPSFLGLFGPVWGCCARYGKYGVCGQFMGNQCLIPVGTPIPTGPAPAPDSGKVENFVRCTPPPAKTDGG